MNLDADKRLLKLIDEALDRGSQAEGLEWLLSQLPEAQHSRASRMLSAAWEPTAEHEGLATEFVNNARDRWVRRRLGAYELKSLIGEGGMGQVFLGRRVDGLFEQNVAVKLIRSIGLSDKAITQFESERQILSDLQHPGIARLYDGGSTEDGFPYVVMEYIDGEPLDSYISSRALTVSQRLHLFDKICAAVDYMHRSLVIHRDIKPGNILVTAAGEPKLIDFGIAKSIAPRDAERTLGGAALTPAYASPEQVLGAKLTTATDVYSLGVVLYQCLTGERPYETSSLSPAEYERVVTQDIPSLPSHRLRERANDLWTTLSGDLDAIVMMALAKEPERRYASATALADDIKRYLTHLPVSAQADSAGYRLRRFVRRRRGWVLTAALIAVVLLGAFAVTLQQYRVAVAERERADLRFDQARQLAHSVFYEIYDQVAGVQGTLSARESIAAVGTAYLDELAGDPTAPDDLLLDFGQQYVRLSDLYGGLGLANLGEADKSWEMLSKAERLIDELLARQPDNLDAIDEMIWIKRLQANQSMTYRSNSADAMQQAQQAMAMADAHRRKNGEIVWPLEVRFWNSRMDHVKVLLWDDKQAEALPIVNRYMAELADPGLQANLPRHEIKTAYFHSLRGELHLDAENYAAALPDLKQASDYYAQQRKASPESSYFMIQGMRLSFSMSKALSGLERFADALTSAELAIQLADRLLALDPLDKGSQRNRAAQLEQYAAVLTELGRYQDAIAIIDEAHTVYTQLLLDQTADVQARRDMANIRFLRGKLELQAGGDIRKACGWIDEAAEGLRLLDSEGRLSGYYIGGYLKPTLSLQAESCGN